MPANKKANPLEIFGVEKSYGATQALKGLSFKLEEGTCTGLLGPNGAGKTTACHIISGLLKADAGKVLIHGLSFDVSREKILSQIGVQLQESRFYEKFTVEETFNLFASFYPSCLDLDELLTKLSLTSYRKKRLGQLSGGLKQRVYIGCALVHDPQLLILDEPMTSLDPISQQEVRNLIKQLKDLGKTILISTHNIDEAEKLCGQVLILDKGKILCQGNPRELVETVCGKEMLTFNIENEEKYSQIKSKLSWLPEFSKRERGIGTDEGSLYLQELTRVSKEIGVDISHLSLRPTNLEDVFFYVTGRSFV